MNEFDPIFEDMYDYCEAQELEVDTLIHESGAAQMEINFLHGDAIDLADQVFLFKRTMREAAIATASMPPSWPSPWQRTRFRHTHPPGPEDMDGNNPFFAPAAALRSVHAFHRRPAEIPAGSDRSVGAERQLPTAAWCLWRDAAPRNVQWGEKTAAACGSPSPNRAHAGSRTASPVPMPIRIWLWPPPWPAATSACWRSQNPYREMKASAYDLPLPARSLEESLSHLEQCEPIKDMLGSASSAPSWPSNARSTRPYFGVISRWGTPEFLLLNVDLSPGGEASPVISQARCRRPVSRRARDPRHQVWGEARSRNGEGRHLQSTGDDVRPMERHRAGKRRQPP